MHSVSEADVSGKKVIVRGDLDLAEENGHIESYRLDRMIPTLRDILDRGGAIRLIAHHGRPEGQVVPNLSLQEFIPLLSDKLGTTVNFAGDLTQNPDPSGPINLFENLRFSPGEESSDPQFVNSLSQLGELYVNECFSTSHRDEASITALPKLLPHFAGLNLMREVEELTKVLE